MYAFKTKLSPRPNWVFTFQSCLTDIVGLVSKLCLQISDVMYFVPTKPENSQRNVIQCHLCHV